MMLNAATSKADGFYWILSSLRMMYDASRFFQSPNRDTARTEFEIVNPQGYIWLAVGVAILAILLVAGLIKYGLA